MTGETVKFGKSKVFFDTFERRPGPIKKNMHYCPGCGHGILHKLIAEAVEYHGIQKRPSLLPRSAARSSPITTTTAEGSRSRTDGRPQSEPAWSAHSRKTS